MCPARKSLRGVTVDSHHDRKSLIGRLKDWYRAVEREAAEPPEFAPFYVAANGKMYADAREVLEAKCVQAQLREFEALRQSLEVRKSGPV